MRRCLAVAFLILPVLFLLSSCPSTPPGNNNPDHGGDGGDGNGGAGGGDGGGSGGGGGEPGIPDLGVNVSLNGAQVFPTDNAWNTPIDTLPVDPNSDDLIDSIGPSNVAMP